MADTENMQALRRAILGSPAYRLAQEDSGFLAEEYLKCFTYADTAEEIIVVLETFYGGRPPPETGPVE